VPEISRFFGIVVTMYYADHPPPHLHARYGSAQAVIDIRTLETLAGGLPPRATGLVVEWTVLHRAELLHNWERARNDEPLEPIEPLE
jgi:hypothetical protein